MERISNKPSLLPKRKCTVLAFLLGFRAVIAVRPTFVAFDSPLSTRFKELVSIQRIISFQSSYCNVLKHPVFVRLFLTGLVVEEFPSFGGGLDDEEAVGPRTDESIGKMFDITRSNVIRPNTRGLVCKYCFKDRRRPCL